ncbi:MAG: ATP-binding protein [Candidatus Parcubacteria bacterium]|nr:ATP-binding protein [Candidatus Parcubacteria bacterium]
MTYVILFLSIINFLIASIVAMHSGWGKKTFTFLLFSFVASLWMFSTYLFRVSSSVFTMRVVYAFGLVLSVSSLLWVYSFLEQKIPIFWGYLFAVIGAGMVYFTLSGGYVISSVVSISQFGHEGENGPFFLTYVLFWVLCVSCLIFNLYHSLHREPKNSVTYKRIKTVLYGVASFIIITSLVNFIIPLFDNSASFAELDVLGFSLFLYSIIYGILKYQLFGIKVIVTEISVFLIWAFLLIQMVGSSDRLDFITNTALLIVLVIAGLVLIKSVRVEVDQREKIEKIADELESVNRHLRVLDKQKSEFVSIASHQLRTPLTAIIGYSSMLLEGSYGKLSDKAVEVVDKVYQSSRRLAGTIDDFLTISHIEQGKMVYTFTTVEMRGLLSGMVEEFSTRAKDEKKELRFTDDGNGNYNVTADNNKIRQVLSNLMDNAIKYSKEGQSIEVSLTKDFITNKTRISIHDSGIGMSSETINNLFQKFNRAKDVQKTYADGNGIGLYIAQEMMKSHYGRIWAESESEGEGKGATFFVELMSEE